SLQLNCLSRVIVADSCSFCGSTWIHEPLLGPVHTSPRSHVTRRDLTNYDGGAAYAVRPISTAALVTNASVPGSSKTRDNLGNRGSVDSRSGSNSATAESTNRTSKPLASRSRAPNDSVVPAPGPSGIATSRVISHSTRTPAFATAPTNSRGRDGRASNKTA